MRLSREQVGIASAAGAAVLFGLSFPITVFALRSFTPLGTAAISCTIAFVILAVLALVGIVPRPALREHSRPTSAGSRSSPSSAG